MNRSITLPTPSNYLNGFVIGFPLLMTIFFVSMYAFQIGDKPLTTPALMLALLIVYGVHAAIFIPVFRRSRIEITHSNLIISVAWYTDTIPWSQIDWSQSGPLDFAKTPSKKPRWRRNGIGAPGYSAGWFSLNDGRRAFLAVTNKQSPLLLLVTPDHDIIVSLDHRDQVWQQLQQHR